MSLQDCETERKIISKKYRSIKRNAQQSRTVFLHDLAAQQAVRGNDYISNIILRMNRNEEPRSSYRRMKAVTKPFCGATQKVLISSNDSEIVTAEKEKIEKALCNENIAKFTMAYSSPFLQKSLAPLLQQTATSSSAKQILHGQFSTSRMNLQRATKRFIKHLEMPPSVLDNPSNNTQCSLQTAVSYWRKKREKTDSSMSQRHIGVYRALTYDLPLLQLVNNVANFTFNIGQPLERWTFDLDVSSLKKPNKIRQGRNCLSG